MVLVPIKSRGQAVSSWHQHCSATLTSALAVTRAGAGPHNVRAASSSSLVLPYTWQPNQLKTGHRVCKSLGFGVSFLQVVGKPDGLSNDENSKGGRGWKDHLPPALHLD